jgi:hypothetical protein
MASDYDDQAATAGQNIDEQNMLLVAPDDAAFRIDHNHHTTLAR